MEHNYPSSSARGNKLSRRRFLQVSAAGTASYVGVGQANAMGVYSVSNNVSEIKDWHDLDDIRNELDGEYILTADLDETSPGYEEHVATPENGWNPIGEADGVAVFPDGSVTVPGDPFTGTFDGNGHEISGLRITRPETAYVGLFAGIEDGTITDVTLGNVEIVGESSVCSLVALNGGGEVIQSTASGNVTGGVAVGGLVAANELGEVRESSADAQIDGEVTVGGLVGNNGGGEISDSSVSGDVHGEEAVGGLCGKNRYHNDAATVSNSSANSTVDGFREVGGLVGVNEGSTIADSSVHGTVSGERIMGGLVGKNERGEVVTSESTGQVNGREAPGEDNRNGWVGGLIGDHMSGVVDQSSASGDVSGWASVGGLVGRNGGTVTNTYSTGDVTGRGGIGGLIGRKDGGRVIESWSSGTADGFHPTRNGGLVANSDSCDVTDSYWDSERSEESEESDCTGAVGLSTTEMQGESAAEMMSALDFEDTWVIQTDPVDYPVLAWQHDDDEKVTNGGDTEQNGDDDQEVDTGRDTDEGTDDSGDTDSDGDSDSGEETDEDADSDEDLNTETDSGEEDSQIDNVDDDGSGLGVGAALAGVGGIAYVLKQRFGTTGPEQ